MGVLALGIAVATLLAGVGWARKREARTAAALEAAQAVEPHKQPMRYLLFLLHLHPPHQSEDRRHGGATAGHDGPMWLHPSARGCPPHS